jgi:hypothetical protein
MKDVVDLLDGEVCKTHQMARRRHVADINRMQRSPRLKLKNMEICLVWFVFPVNKWALPINKSSSNSPFNVLWGSDEAGLESGKQRPLRLFCSSFDPPHFVALPTLVR